VLLHLDLLLGLLELLLLGLLLVELVHVHIALHYVFYLGNH
jgi:hypothetical protein